MDLSLLGMLSAAGGGSSSSKKAEGNPVVLDGLQGGVPFNRVEVSGKNLIPFPYYDGMSKTVNGITYTVNSDGSITANGTATARAYFHMHYKTEYLEMGTTPNQTYTFSCCPSGAGSKTYNASISVWNGDTFVKGLYEYGNGNTFTREETTTSYACAIAVEGGVTVENLVFHPQLELGDTATEYEPPITGRDLTVGVCGKNLFGDVMNYYLSGTQQDGFNFKPSSANSFCFLGTIINNTNYAIKNYSNGNRFKIVLFKNYPDQAAPDECMEILPTFSNTVTFNSGEYNYCVLSVAYNDKNISIKKAQLEIGSTPTDYEPYHGAEYTITPDSNPYTVPVDITQYDDINVLSIVDDSSPIISVNANKASEQLSKIYSSLNNKPVLLFDGTIPTSSMDGYAEFTIDKEYSAFMIVPICNDSNVYEPGACTVIPIGYATEEEQGFTVYGYPRSLQRVTRAFIKRVGDAFYVRSQSTACGYMTIYGI